MNPLLILQFLDTPEGKFAAKLGAGVVTLAIVFGTGFYKGDRHRAKLDGADAAQAKIEFLQRQLDARDAAAKQEATQARADNAALAADLEQAKNAQAKISTGPCLDGNDVERVRSIWRAGKRAR